MGFFKHVCLILLLLLSFGRAEDVEEEFMFMPIHSFQSPFLFGMSHNIPFWEFGGDAVATEDYIRLAPNVQSKDGWLWNTQPINMENWQVLLDFHIHNTHSPGADGLAFWITKEGKNIPEVGPLYGYTDKFTGIGILFDTYDNNHNGDNPAVVLIRNEGYEVAWDIENDFISNELGRCLSHYRNPINDKSTAMIRYTNGKLKVSMDTYSKGDFRECFEVDIDIPMGYYFGMTAATGGLTDNHDLLGMYVRQITTEDVREEGPAEEPSRKGWYDPYSNSGEKELGEDSSSKMQKKLKETVERKKKKKEKNARNREAENFAEAESAEAERADLQKVLFDELKKKLETIGHPDIYDEEGNLVPAEFDDDDDPDDEEEGEDSLDDFSHETGIVILEALEEVVSQIRHSSTKSDISQIIRRVEDVSDSQREVGEMLIGTNEEIKSDMKVLSERLTKQTSKLREELSKLDGVINSLAGSVSDMKKKQGNLENRVTSSNREMTNSIRSSSSWGFWTFFMIFQVMFIISFFFYKKFRDEKKKLI